MALDLLDGIAALLAADAGFAAAVPGPIADTLLPEGATLPALTYQVVGGEEDPTFDTAGLARVRVQFDVRAADGDSARAGRKNLIRVLNGFRGQLPSGGPWVEGIQLIERIDYFDNDARQFRKGAEFYVFTPDAEGEIGS